MSVIARDVVSIAGCDHSTWTADPATIATRTTQAFLGDVDFVLGRFRVEHPSPLVLAGAWGLTAAPRKRSDHMHRLAGVLAPAECASERVMLTSSSRLLETYLGTREAEALELVARICVEHPQRLAAGIDAACEAARTEQPLMLAVEDGYAVPGVPTDSPQASAGSGTSVGGLDVVHDLVDDLIEIVIERGGWVALVRDGQLLDHGRVALVTRTRRP